MRLPDSKLPSPPPCHSLPPFHQFQKQHHSKCMPSPPNLLLLLPSHQSQRKTLPSISLAELFSSSSLEELSFSFSSSLEQLFSSSFSLEQLFSSSLEEQPSSSGHLSSERQQTSSGLDHPLCPASVELHPRPRHHQAYLAPPPPP